jgi:Domain of unknown function (DUF4111)
LSPPDDDYRRAVEGYLAELTRRIGDALGADLVGVYLMGSAGMGADVPGVSDLDVWALVRGAVPLATRRALAARVDHAALPCPARGLELVVARLGRGGEPVVELNLNDGPGMERHVALDASGEPSHWFVLDAAIGREHGRALAGPPPGEALPPVPRSAQLAAIAESLDWYAAHEPDNRKAVLTAARGWRYAVEGTWSSKEEAARWAAARRPSWAAEIEAALAARRAAR